MSNDTQNTLPLPSDRTLTTDYVALKPGNYKARTDLTPYKGKNLTNNQILDYKPESPFGIGDALSVVYVYPQGTIEIIGNVYCWNKLVKPGIYSQFEKIRYLNNEVVLPRVESNVFQHHASYDKTIRVPNRFVSKNSQHAEPIIQYHYVDFNEQIVSTNGDKVYPIPVLGGTLTLYPDGTFKTEGVVVKSTDSKLVDEYGYLGDGNDYGTLNLFYNDITKDDVNPKNVYQVLSENEDGSITYGAIDLNKHLVRDSWVPLPPGIIPVNDGKVSISTNGLMTIDGTVITDKGHLILPGTVYYRELFTKDKQGNLNPNPNMVDTSVVYNPRMEVIGDLDWGKTVLAIADGKKSIYEYHMDNYQVIQSEEGPTVLYLPMDGWDTFTTAAANPKFNMAYLSKFVDATLIENKDKYPWYGGQVKIGGFYLTGKVRPFPKTKSFKYYPIFDHRCFWNPDNISSEPIPYDRVIHLNKETFETRKQEWLIQYDKLGNEIDNTFVPYRSLKRTDEISSVRLTNTNIETSGTVVWKRNDQYYSIFGNNQTELYTDWPDIKEFQGSYLELFTPLGYFKDEPIFISKEGDGTDPHGNYEDSFDGIRRQEPGVFNIVTRNITHYLTSLEKALIDNYYKENIIIVGDYNTLDFYVKHYHRLDGVSDTTRSKLTLEYHGYRFAEVYPRMLSIKNTLFASRNVLTDLLRVYRYTRDEESTSPYWDVASVGSQYQGGHHIFSQRSKLLSVKEKGNTRLLRVAPHASTYKDYHNVEYNESHWGYYEEPNFNVTERVILSEASPIVVANNGNGIQYFYHTSEDLKYITGSFTLSRNESFTIPITLENKYGYIDVWYDDPFDEHIDTNYRNPNVKRIKLRKDRSITPLKLLFPEQVTNNTQKIIGSGEPRAMLTLIDNSDPNTVLLTKRVDNSGTWSLNNLPELIVGDTYTITQTDEFGITSRVEFTVVREKLKEGDYITPRQLFGRNVYAYPVNLRNVNNLPGEANLIDSQLSFDVANETYTIEGLFVDREGNIFKEGTYPLGVTPEVYRSNVLGITTFDFPPQHRYKGNDVYRFSRRPYRATTDMTHHSQNTSLLANQLTNEDWVFSKQWLDDAVNYISDIDDATFTQLYGTEFTKEDIRLFVTNFKTYLRHSDISIGRFQNKLTIDVLCPMIVNTTNTLAYYIYRNNAYRKEGYTIQELIPLLKRNAPWWDIPLTTLNVQNRRQINEYDRGVLIRSNQVDQMSYTKPIGYDTHLVFKLTSTDNVRINGKLVVTPNEYTTTLSKTLYEFDGWDSIKSTHTNGVYEWLYKSEYGYTLDRNYDEMNPKMADDVLQHWTNKGYPPSLFVFDNWANGRVVYHDDGETVTIYGRVKVGGRYTRNITQSAVPKSGIQFLSFCPNAYYPADNSGRITLNDDDSITIEGFVMYRVVDEDCNPITVTPSKEFDARLEHVKIESVDGSSSFININNPANTVMIEYKITNIDREDIDYVKTSMDYSGTFVNFGTASREYNATNSDGNVYGFSYDADGLATNEMSQGGVLVKQGVWRSHTDANALCTMEFIPIGTRTYGVEYGDLYIRYHVNPLGVNIPEPGTYTSQTNFEINSKPTYHGYASDNYGELSVTFAALLDHPDKLRKSLISKPIVVRSLYVNPIVYQYTGD